MGYEEDLSGGEKVSRVEGRVMLAFVSERIHRGCERRGGKGEFDPLWS